MVAIVRGAGYVTGNFTVRFTAANDMNRFSRHIIINKKDAIIERRVDARPLWWVFACV